MCDKSFSFYAKTKEYLMYGIYATFLTDTGEKFKRLSYISSYESIRKERDRFNLMCEV